MEENVPLVRRIRVQRPVSPELEEYRRNCPPHTRKSCGGCLGFYDKKGKLVRHRPLPMSKLL